MKKNIVLSFVVFSLVFVSCQRTSGPSTATSPPIDNTPLDKLGKPLGFKGIHIGMSKEELKKLSKRNDFPWMYELDGAYVAYKADEKEGWIGSVGEKGHERFFYFDPVIDVNWYNDNAVGIYIRSYRDVTADRINVAVKPWMKFALDRLAEKYGPPTKVFFRVENMDISSFESNRVIYFYKWEKANERVTIGAGETRATYYCEIGFEDVKGIAELTKAKKSNVKSEF